VVNRTMHKVWFWVWVIAALVIALITIASILLHRWTNVAWEICVILINVAMAWDQWRRTKPPKSM
jgi:hypothetical protein